MRLKRLGKFKAIKLRILYKGRKIKRKVTVPIRAMSEKKEKGKGLDQLRDEEIKFPESMERTRKEQIRIRAKCEKGELEPRGKYGKKPKGSRNVPLKQQAPSSDTEEGGSKRTYTVDETLSGIKIRVLPIVDPNSSFDDRDELSVMQSGEEDSGQPESEQEKRKIIFRTPVKRITFNPTVNSIKDIASLMMPAKYGGWREQDSDTLSEN